MKSFSPVIETISFLSINKTLVCIDDLERKGKGLEIKDVLGLVSILKEQKKCKVVLLLNEGEEGLKDYQKYREKVIDIQLAFAPGPQECAEIAYNKDTPTYNRLKDLTENLGIRNIRILKKIERLVNLSLPLTKEFEKEIKDQVISSLVLYTWSYYCSNSNADIPTLEFITREDDGVVWPEPGDETGNETVNEQHEKWQTTLKAYDYQYTDELDLLLAEAVKKGFFVEEDFDEIATIKNQGIIASKSRESFTQTWKHCYGNFKTSDNDVINDIYNSFEKNYTCLTPTDLDGTISLFRKLGVDSKATEIIDFYIKKRKDDIELFNIDKRDYYRDVSDKEIIEKFNKTYKHHGTTEAETVKQVLERIGSQNIWNQTDEAILANTTSDEYFDLFKSETDPNLSTLVTGCLKFGQRGNPSEQQQQIANRAKEALKKIALESTINKIRVKSYGVNVEDIQ